MSLEITIFLLITKCLPVIPSCSGLILHAISKHNINLCFPSMSETIQIAKSLPLQASLLN